MKNKNPIRQRIIDKIRESKLTIPQVAAKADINKGTLYKFLKGETHIRPENLERILDALASP